MSVICQYFIAGLFGRWVQGMVCLWICAVFRFSESHSPSASSFLSPQDAQGWYFSGILTGLSISLAFCTICQQASLYLSPLFMTRLAKDTHAWICFGMLRKHVQIIVHSVCIFRIVQCSGQQSCRLYWRFFMRKVANWPTHTPFKLDLFIINHIMVITYHQKLRNDCRQSKDCILNLEQ